MSHNPAKIVPDGGWGWVIVSVSLAFHFLIGFVFSSQSVLYLALQHEFGHGKGVTSWILSVFNAFLVFLGPLSASLGVKYGYKAVTFVGGLLMGIGYFLSFFATSIIYLTLAIGVIAGSGAGLTYVPVITMCALYFDKKRSLAVGLGTAGYGMGSFVCPPLIAYLEEEYTWRGVLLITCGCLLNMCVLSLLMHPLKSVMPSAYHAEENGNPVNGEIGNTNEEKITLNGVPMSDLTAVAVKEVVDAHDNQRQNGVVRCESGHNLGDPSLSRLINSEIVPSPVDEVCKSTSKSLLPNNSNTTIDAMAEIVKRKKYLLPMEAERSRSHSFNYRSSASLDCIKPNATNHHQYRSAHEISKSRNSNLDIIVNPNKRHKSSVNELSPQLQGSSITNMSIMLIGSIYNIVTVDSKLNSMLSLNSKTTRGEVESHKDEIEYEMSSPSTHQAEPSNHPVNKTLHHIYDVLKDYINLMTNCKFSLMVVINILVSLTYLIPVLFIVDRAVDNGIDKDEAVLALSLYGAGNLCGRILIGAIADLPCMNRMVLYFICIFFCGLVTSLSVFFGACLPLHNVYGFCFGMLIGGYVILTPLVLVDMLGVEMVGKSYGLLIVFQGFAMLTGAPMAGWIRDITGSYSITFVLFGSFMVFSALLTVPLIYVSIKGDNCDKSSQDERAPLDSSP